MSIEVEKKCLLTKSAYEKLPKQLLKLGAVDKGKNDTESLFYIIENAQFKIQSRKSKKSAKLVWKSGGFDGASSRKEIELNFDYKERVDAENLIDSLLPNTQKVPTTQLRHDFEFDGIGIALKYSEHWGYHAELDKIVKSKTEITEALKSIEKLARKMQLTLLSDAEEERYVASMLEKL